MVDAGALESADTLPHNLAGEALEEELKKRYSAWKRR